MIRLIDDLATTTQIAKYTLGKLETEVESCIAHAVFEGLSEGVMTTEVDIGIGVLYIRREQDSVKYKFIPSQSFERLINDTIITKTSPLIERAESSLRERIEAGYKNLL